MKKDAENTTEQGNEANTMLPTVIYCDCDKVESYRMNGISELICGRCDKKLTKEQSNDVGRSIASYYGW